jgi:hypothetical protein
VLLTSRSTFGCLSKIHKPPYRHDHRRRKQSARERADRARHVALAPRPVVLTLVISFSRNSTFCYTSHELITETARTGTGTSETAAETAGRRHLGDRAAQTIDETQEMAAHREISCGKAATTAVSEITPCKRSLRLRRP